MKNVIQDYVLWTFAKVLIMKVIALIIQMLASQVYFVILIVIVKVKDIVENIHIFMNYVVMGIGVIIKNVSLA